MIGRTSLMLLTLAAGAGAALFHVSYDVSALEDRLASLNRQIVDDQEAIHVLRAEWSFLNQPARLEELSQRHLDLQPLTGSQIGGVAMLPVRLHEPDDATPDDGNGDGTTAIAALTETLAGPRPLLKPVPPLTASPRKRANAADAPAARRTSPLVPGGGAIPVAARSLDDVLADLTRRPRGPGVTR